MIGRLGYIISDVEQKDAKRQQHDDADLNLPAPAAHLLHHEHHSAQYYDVSAAAVDLLLHARAEGSDWRRRAAVVPHLSAQRH